MLTLSVLTKMLLLTKWAVWMTVSFLSSASPPWLMEFPLDIHALKEMTLVPLLHSELFQRFDFTPPRGVIFHGSHESEKLSSQELWRRRYVRIFPACKHIPLTHRPTTSLFHVQRHGLPFQVGRRS